MSRAPFGVALLCLCGCLSGEDVGKEIRRFWETEQQPVIAKLQADNEKLLGQLAELRAVTLCSPELRRLISLVDKEGCTKPEPAAAEATASCPPQKLYGLLSRWDPYTRQNLLRLINHQPHTYVYFGPQTQIPSYRLRKVETLAKDRINPNTRFLVLGRIDPSEKEAGEVHANERTQAVAAALRDFKVAADRVVPWNLAFQTTMKDIPVEDQPVAKADGDGTPSRLVVVFRVDC